MKKGETVWSNVCITMRDSSSYCCKCSSTYGVCNSSTYGPNTFFAVGERAVNACPSFFFTILDVTAAIR
eukprot:scaffold158084_cov19-Tisochrysis_lutea.AAC.1